MNVFLISVSGVLFLSAKTGELVLNAMRVGNKGYERNTKGGRTLINHKKLENFVETVTFVFSENFSFLQLFVNLSDLVVLLVPSKLITLDQFFIYG